MEAGADCSADRDLRRDLVDRVCLIDEASAERVVMLIAAGETHAKLLRDIRFGIAVNAPAPLIPATCVGRTGTTIAAGARALHRGSSDLRVHAGRSLHIERVRDGVRPAAIGLRITRGRTVGFLPIFGAPGESQ